MQPFTLFLLGTDTQFCPGPLANNYDKAETLSFAATLIAANDSTYPINDVIQYRNGNTAVINGPTTLGSEVGQRIMLGLHVLLEAIGRGKTEINVSGHSRGAVEAILLVNILSLIQDNASIEETIKCAEEFCFYRPTEIPELRATFEALNWDAIKTEIKKVTVAVFNIDPVPGGDFLWLTRPSRSLGVIRVFIVFHLE